MINLQARLEKVGAAKPGGFRRFAQVEYSLSVYGVVASALLFVFPLGLLLAPLKFWSLYSRTAVGVGILFLLLVGARVAQLVIGRLRRAKLLQAYALRHSYNYGVASQHEFVDSLGVIAGTAVDYSDFDLQNTLKTPHWVYSDFAYIRRTSPNYGAPELWRANYGVVSVELPCQFPNIFFDSTKAFGSQFKRRISPHQIRRLESYFDKYFTSYFPQDFSADPLQIIDADVMVALIEAANYDVEIFGNHVMLYGAQVNSVQQLEDMAEKAKNISAALQKSVAGAEPIPQGRLTVSASPNILKQTSFWTSVAACLAAMYLLPYAVMLMDILYVWATEGWSAAIGLY